MKKYIFILALTLILPASVFADGYSLLSGITADAVSDSSDAAVDRALEAVADSAFAKYVDIADSAFAKQSAIADSAFAKQSDIADSLFATQAAVADSAFLHNAALDDSLANYGAFTDSLKQDSQFILAIPTADHIANGDKTYWQVDANSVGLFSALHVDTDGNLIEADADGTATMPCIALALETGTGFKQVITKGFVRDDTWTWTPGGIIYVSATVGTLTQTAPAGTGDQVQAVGVATHADRMYFNPSLVLVEVP